MKENLIFLAVIDSNVDVVLFMEALNEYHFTVKRMDTNIFIIVSSDENDDAQIIFNKLKNYIKLPNEAILMITPLEKFYGRLPVGIWEWLKVKNDNIKIENE